MSNLSGLQQTQIERVRVELAVDLKAADTRQRTLMAKMDRREIGVNEFNLQMDQVSRSMTFCRAYADAEMRAIAGGLMSKLGSVVSDPHENTRH